jgi:hypothetical protein
VADATAGVISDAAEHVGEIGVGLDGVELRGLDDGVSMAARSLPLSEPANSQLLRPRASGRMARSAALLVISSRSPCSCAAYQPSLHPVPTRPQPAPSIVPMIEIVDTIIVSSRRHTIETRQPLNRRPPPDAYPRNGSPRRCQSSTSSTRRSRTGWGSSSRRSAARRYPRSCAVRGSGSVGGPGIWCQAASITAPVALA